MRVIAGTARSLQLKTPAGTDVRPTTDRIKETLFNIINNGIYGCNFLDLFAGSGGIGIEALSRGAEFASFVDNYEPSLKCIADNLEHTHFTDRSEVIKSDSISALALLSSRGRSYDYIFLDPPYGKGLEEKAVESIMRYGLLKDDGIIIIETLIGVDAGYVSDYELTVTREKVYGSNKHIFISKTEEQH